MADRPSGGAPFSFHLYIKKDEEFGGILRPFDKCDSPVAFFCLIEANGLTCGDNMPFLAGQFNVDIGRRWVIYRVGKYRELEAGKCRRVVVDLNVRRVPNVLSAAHIFAKLLDDAPVIVVVKLVRVSPKVEEP